MTRETDTQSEHEGAHTRHAHIITQETASQSIWNQREREQQSGVIMALAMTHNNLT